MRFEPADVITRENIPGTEFYLKKTEQIARELIGKIFARNIEGTILKARIVETEAYLSNGDDASHSAPGPTKRNEAMFEKGGILYVYKIYGIHFCANIVTESKGIGSAVLIRGGEPLEGIEKMKEYRNTDDEKKLCKGPGNFAKAFGLNLENNFTSLQSKKLFLAEGFLDDNEEIINGPRIGIGKSKELNLRYFIKGNVFVSGKNS